MVCSLQNDAGNFPVPARLRHAATSENRQTLSVSE